MASTPRKHPKPYSKPTHSPSSSSSFNSLMEPPEHFFPSKSELFKLLAVIAVATSVAALCNYVATILSHQSKPFCDTNADSHQMPSDLCEPCPSNAECYQGMMECVRGYRKHGKLCIEDGDINETAKKLANRIETHVCEAYAQFLCDETGSVWVQEDEVWNDVDELKMMKSLGLEDATYMYKKQRAMEMIDRLLETKINHQGIKELKCPDLLAEHYKPFSCRVQQWISNHALVLTPVCALLVGSILLLRRIRQRRNLSARAEQLYNQICDILEENALMTKDGNGEGEPWVVVSWLRDHLLLPKERKDPLLWRKCNVDYYECFSLMPHYSTKRLRRLVQEDSRLDRYPKLVKGESKVVWEWQVEGSLSSSRLRKRREASKLKPSGGTNINSDVQSQAMKAGEVINC